MTATAVVEDYPNRGAPTADDVTHNNTILVGKDHWVHQNREYNDELRAIVLPKLEGARLHTESARAGSAVHRCAGSEFDEMQIKKALRPKVKWVEV